MKQTITNAATASHWEKVAATAATAATEAAASIRTTWNPVEIEAYLHAAESATATAKEAAAEAMTAAAAEAAEAAAAAYTAAKWGANLSRYEGAYSRRDNDPDGYAAALQTAARAIASSVIAKTIDPQRRDAVKRDSVSNSGYNTAMVALRREVMADCTHLDNLYAAEAAAFGARVHHKKDGDTVIMRYVVDDTAAAVMDGMELDRLGDGIDLVNEAAAAILEQSTAHATSSPGWMEVSYTMRRIKRRVLVKHSDTAAWEEVDTSPVREAFRAVRRAVADSRAVVADPRSKYCYIEDLAAASDDSSTLEVVYRRLHKYADIGGYAHTGHAGRNGADCGGLYSVDMQSYRDYNAVLELLNMTAAQAEFVRLRMEGYGSAAIASYMGVSEGRVYNIAAALRKKCAAIDFAPVNAAIAKLEKEKTLRTIIALERAAKAADARGDATRADHVYNIVAERCEKHNISRADLNRERARIAREVAAQIREANFWYTEAARAATEAAATAATEAAAKMENNAIILAEKYGITSAALKAL